MKNGSVFGIFFLRMFIGLVALGCISLSITIFLSYHPIWILPYPLAAVCFLMSAMALLYLQIPSFRFPFHKILGLLLCILSGINLCILFIPGFTVPSFLFFPFEPALIFFLVGLFFLWVSKRPITAEKFIGLAFLTACIFFTSLEAFLLSRYFAEQRYFFEHMPFIRPITAFFLLLLGFSFFSWLGILFLQNKTLLKRSLPYVISTCFLILAMVFSLRIWAEKNVRIKKDLKHRALEMKESLSREFQRNVQELQQGKRDPNWMFFQTYDASLQGMSAENDILLPEVFTQKIRTFPGKEVQSCLYYLQSHLYPYLVVFVPKIAGQPFQGGQAALFDLHKLISSALHPIQKEKYMIQIKVLGALCFSWNEEAYETVHEYLYTQKFSVYDVEWTLQIAPTKTLFDVEAPGLVLWVSIVGGILIAGLLGGIAFLWQRSRQQLDYILEMQHDLELALDSADVGLWKWDVKDANHAFFLSPQAIRLLGLPSEKKQDLFSFEEIKNCVHPEDRTTFEHKLYEELQKGNHYYATFRVMWKDDSVHYLLGKAMAHLGLDQSIQSIRGAFVDTTELQKTLELLHRSEEKIRSLIESIQEWIWEVNLEGKLIYTNPNVYEMLGYDPQQVMGMDLFLLLKEEAYEPCRKVFQHCISHRVGTVGWSSEWRRKDGSFLWIETNYTPFFSSRNELMGFQGASRNIQERKEIEIFKNEFLSNVSHDLRTPLTSIYGSLSLLVKKYPAECSPKIKELLDVAYRNAERLLSLIHQLLESQELDMGKMQYDLKLFPIQQVLLDVVKLSEPMASLFQVTLKLEDPLSPSFVQADYGRLMEVMTNLLSNAIKFSPQGSSVTLSTLDQGEWVRVLVKDEGRGIPEEFSSQIFQRFARGSHDHKDMVRGAGLGLSICKAIIEGLGGKIGYRSELGQGSVFYFDLRKQIGSS